MAAVGLVGAAQAMGIITGARTGHHILAVDAEGSPSGLSTTLVPHPSGGLFVSEGAQRHVGAPPSVGPPASSRDFYVRSAVGEIICIAPDNQIGPWSCVMALGSPACTAPLRLES